MDAPQLILTIDGRITIDIDDRWTHRRAIFAPTDSDKFKAMTGMEDPEEELGLNVDLWTRFRSLSRT